MRPFTSRECEPGVGSPSEGSGRSGGSPLNWLIAYAVIGVVVAAAASVFSDRFRTDAGGAALLAGLLWPLLVLGAAQMALWTAVVRLARRRAPAPRAREALTLSGEQT